MKVETNDPKKKQVSEGILMDEHSTAAYLPYQAINEFMRDDFRVSVIQKVLIQSSSLAPELREPINQLTRKFVQVPGFRNSAKAPARVRIKPSAEVFMKNAEFTVAILNAWGSLNPVLEKQVTDLLSERGWELPPLQNNPGAAPGFLTDWPDSESFDSIQHAFQEKYPETDADPDEIGLMVVWSSGRLPYHSNELEKS